MIDSVKPRILLIEDDSDIAEFIAIELRAEGFDVHVERDGMRGLMTARQSSPNLVVVDRMLPSLSGLEICQRLRKTSNVPIIMLTALGQTRDRLEGFATGATDYLAKPFAIEELIARVRAQLSLCAPPVLERFIVGDLSVDLLSREVFRGSDVVTLTVKEFDLLLFLVQHARQVMTREQILMAVWGYDFGGEDNVLEVTMSHLRAKVERPDGSKLLHTVRGIGYVVRDADAT
jgi:DNA-binding response OmpR family regulator